MHSADEGGLGEVDKLVAARTIDDTCDAIAAALKTFPPNECQRYLTNSGYASA